MCCLRGAEMDKAGAGPCVAEIFVAVCNLVTFPQSLHAAGYSIQGRLHDIGLIVGGGITRDTPATREFAFKIYRYCNCRKCTLRT